MDCLRPAFCGGIPCRALGAVARTLSLPLIIPTAVQPSAAMRGSWTLDAGSWFRSHMSHAYMMSKAYLAQSSLLNVRTLTIGIGTAPQNAIKTPRQLS